MSTYFIDDADWDTPRLSLSPGWKMISQNATGDHFLDAGEVERMRPLLKQFHSGTMSWTTAKHSSNQILFNGTGIAVYGLTGPLQGTFAAVLDHTLLGAYNALNDIDMQYLLFSSKGLQSGPHNLTMVNMDQGKAFTFDYAVVETGLAQMTVSVPSQSASNSATPSSSPTAQSSRLLNGPVTPAPAVATSQPMMSAPHAFTWSPVLIFVIAFGSVILLSTLCGILYLFLVIRKRRPQAKTESIPAKDNAKRGRRRTLMEALRSRRIGAPKAVPEPYVRDFRVDSDGSMRNGGAADGEKEDWDEERQGR